jgi:hypothetical protein
MSSLEKLASPSDSLVVQMAFKQWNQLKGTMDKFHKLLQDMNHYEQLSRRYREMYQQIEKPLFALYLTVRDAQVVTNSAKEKAKLKAIENKLVDAIRAEPDELEQRMQQRFAGTVFGAQF